MFTVVFASVLLPLIALNAAIEVDTKYGTVIGKTITVHTGKTIHSFNGIPYAKPPVGDLRWREPEEPDPWDEPFEAIELGTSCVQSFPNEHTLTHPLWNNYGEDCLNLNIVAPEDLDGSYPVMVWLHGGGYQSSSNIQYPGHFMAAYGDVVVVVPNYRLAIIGFGTTKDDTARGNWGMHDHLLALKFVQENIVNFGGDPSQVTIFGESAGGTTTGLMLMSPLATGLFHQAILHSGTEFNSFAFASPDDTENYMAQVARNFECDDSDMEEMMDCLREVDNPLALINSNRSCTPGYSCSFRPVVDGYFLPDTPTNLRERGEYNQVPEMLGSNSEDGYIGVSQTGYTREQFENYVRSRVRSAVPLWPDPEREEDMVQAALFHYTPWPYLDDRRANRQAVGDYATDNSFGAMTDWQAKQHAKDGNPTFLYVFNHISNNTILPDWMGSVHATDVPYTFGYPMLQFNDDVKNNTGLTFAPINYDEVDVAMSEFMITLWTNFAKFGNPTPAPVPNPGDGPDVTWEPLTPDQLNYLWLGKLAVDVETRVNFRQKEYSFLQYYAPYIAYGEEIPFMGMDNTMDDFGLQDVIETYAQALQEEEEIFS